MYVWSPKDAILKNVSFTPDPQAGSPAFTAEAIELNLSTVAGVYQKQYADSMIAMQSMSQEQAKVWIQNAVTAGQIIPEVAKTLIESFIPLLAP